MHYLVTVLTKFGKYYNYTNSDIPININVNNEAFVSKAKMQVSSAESDNETTVGNLEITIFLDDNLTYKNLVAGELKNARWVLYEHRDNKTKKLNAGIVGEVTISNKRSAKVELLDNAKLLMQHIGMVDQRACRAVFGKDRDEYLGCGVNANDLWREHTVIGVDNFEPNGTFEVDGIIQNNAKIEGRVRFISGENKSSTIYQIDYIQGQKIRLFETTPFNIQIYDRIEIRPDCDKTPNMCKNVYQNMLNYNGEPFIPVDGLATMTPKGDN